MSKCDGWYNAWIAWRSLLNSDLRKPRNYSYAEHSVFLIQRNSPAKRTRFLSDDRIAGLTVPFATVLWNC